MKLGKFWSVGGGASPLGSATGYTRWVQFPFCCDVAHLLRVAINESPQHDKKEQKNKKNVVVDALWKLPLTDYLFLMMI